jgi:hypothetical protein
MESLLTALASGDLSVLPALETFIGDGLVEEGKVYLPVVQKGYKRGSYVVADKRVPAQFVVVDPKKSIRLVGVYYPRGDKRAYDRTFAIGDWAEYDSYNLAYHGKITSIGAGGNVTVLPEHSKRAKRLDAYTFTFRNYDLDLEAAAKRNSDWLVTG